MAEYTLAQINADRAANGTGPVALAFNRAAQQHADSMLYYSYFSLFRVASKVSRAVVSAAGADGFRFVQNNGEAANQVVAHVHVHVIPVKMEDKGRFGDRKRLSKPEMDETAKIIRAKMGQA